MCLSFNDLVKGVSNNKNYLSVEEAIRDAPNYCGVYSIRINDINLFPEEIVMHQKEIAECENVIYIGMANPSTINKRLVMQDLQNTGAAIFFRKLGSVLGKVAILGSGKNYKFEISGREDILNWIKENLKVRYFKYPANKFTTGELHNLYEVPSIAYFKPAFNDNHVPRDLFCRFVKNVHLPNYRIGKTII